MRKRFSPGAQASGITVLFVLGLIAGGLTCGRPGQALPVFARRYDVTCDTCHTVAPALNAFGQAFQVNHFNWPGGHPPARKGLRKIFPVSGLASFSQTHFQGTAPTSADFRTLELYLSDGFSLGASRDGGYLFDTFAATNDVRAGNLENAFVSLPIAGAQGQLALTAGQFTPMMYQYDPLNSLAQSLPAALADDTDAFSFTDANPGVRLDYFSNRGSLTANGDYVTLGAPFAGHLTANSDSRLYGPRGVFLHAFRRRGPGSVGVFGYEHVGHHLEGLIGTYTLGQKLSLLGVGAAGRDISGSTHRLSLETDYVPTSQLALSARLEALGGSSQDTVQVYPVGTVTFYPFGQSVFRVTGETIGQKGSRSSAIYAFVQF